MYVDLYLLSCYSTIEKVTVKCNQTGKLFKVRVSSLSRSDDGHLSRTDLVEGSQLLMRMNRKEYPITVQNVSVSPKEALKEVQVDGKCRTHRCVNLTLYVHIFLHFI